jgi:hypothetical protein
MAFLLTQELTDTVNSRALASIIFKFIQMILNVLQIYFNLNFSELSNPIILLMLFIKLFSIFLYRHRFVSNDCATKGDA